MTTATATPTAATTKPARKSKTVRTLRILARHRAGSGQALSVATVRLTVDGKAEVYNLTSKPEFDGMEVLFRKRRDGAQYRVIVSETMGNRCRCKGFRGHGHCKHVDFVLYQAAVEQQQALPVVVDPFDCHDAE